MDLFTIIKDNITANGAINSLLYLAVNFLLLPIIDKYSNIKISLTEYIIWYVWSITYTIYVLYILQKDKLDSMVNKVTYNWFIKGGYKSYQDIFILSEVEPLYEYLILAVLIIIPTSNSISYKNKFQVILLKIAMFHIISSFMLMDWKSFRVNYKFRKINK
tara:strand:- start:3118 stop:3600 length:483 start_codon:yes stop_codon:yes gene_type:complete